MGKDLYDPTKAVAWEDPCLRGGDAGVDPALAAEVRAVMQRAYELWERRQRKYGKHNIAARGAIGCVVRATDKVERLWHFYAGGSPGDFEDEAVEDAFLDLVNYGIMGLMCHEGTWK